MSPLAMRSAIEFKMTVMCSTGRPYMASSGPWLLSHKPTVYAQGGAISSPSTAETDQPTAWMSSATAVMQASGSRSGSSSSAAHSAHRHRSSGALARRLRDGFMPDTLRGGYDIFGAPRGPGVPRVPGLLAGDAQVPLDGGQPLLDPVQQGGNRRLPSQRDRPQAEGLRPRAEGLRPRSIGKVVLVFWMVLQLLDDSRPELDRKSTRLNSSHL